MAATVPMDDPVVARALGNPRRHRLLLELGEPATISQLAHRLAMNKGSVSHHLAVLAEARLVRVVGTRTVRGGTEIYHQRVDGRVVIDDDERVGAGDAMTEAVLDAVRSDPRGHLHHRALRLTADQAAHLRVHLDALVESLEPARPGEQTYGVVVGVYRRRAQP